MNIDIHEKSQNLLEVLENSLHDRNPKIANEFSFSSSELLVTEKWLLNFVQQIKDKWGL